MDAKLRLIFNSLCSVAGRMVSSVVGLILIPFMLERLGSEAFAVIPIITSSILPFLEIFTGGTSAFLGRYITFHHARKETEEANRYFNASFFALLGLCAVSILPILALGHYFPHVFNVAEGWERRSQWTMLLAGVGFIVTAVSSPFAVGMYYKQRFDLRNAFDVLAALARAGTIVLLFILVGANTVFVAVGMIVAATIQGAANIATAYRMVPGLQISWRLFSKAKLKEVSQFSFFVVLARLSVLLFVGTDYMLINWLIGKGEVTVYNLGARWAPLIKNLAAAAVFVLGPLVTILDATDQRDRIRAIFLRGVRMMSLTVCPVALFFSALATPFMGVWVGRIYPDAVQPAVHVLWVMMLPMVINLSVVPAFPMFTALGRVRAVALVTLAAAIANVGLSIWLALGLDLGIFGIALGSAICLTAKNAVFIPLYMGRLCNVTIKEFYRIFPGPVAACLPGAAFAILIQYLTDVNSWLAIILVGMGSLLSYGLIVYFWCLSRQEKAELFDIWARVKKMLTREQESQDE